MKKIIILSASVAAVFAGSAAHAACHKPASGYTFAIGPAYKNLNGRQRVTTGGPTIISTYKDRENLSSSVAAGVVSLGYGQQGIFSPNTYLGVEINGNVGKVTSKSMHAIPDGAYVEGYTTSFENKYTVGGALRVGYVHNSTLWFLSVGGSSGRFDFRYTDITHTTLTKSPRKKKQLGAVTWGIGAQTHFKKVLLKAEVGFAHHKSFKVPTYKPNAYNNTFASPIAAKMTPRTSIASVSIGYSW